MEVASKRIYYGKSDDDAGRPQANACGEAAGIFLKSADPCIYRITCSTRLTFATIALFGSEEAGNIYTWTMTAE
jgi:hypothetical protein